jgi:tRNA-specific 2-thiouridylase
MKKVLVAMSGGVDSSVAALLLMKSGAEVVGVTMCLGVKDTSDDEKARCCGPDAVTNAKKVCQALGIAHHVFDFSKQLEKDVIEPFLNDYRDGRTPNPCIECNRSLKFRDLFAKAKGLGFDYLATGHYVGIRKSKKSGYQLVKAIDEDKDQSYFLYPIRREDLPNILFPLSDFKKSEVRALARKEKLPVAENPESQDICFIPEESYHSFLIEHGVKPVPGPIVDMEGRVLGEHKGICFYTIGQRDGLGGGATRRLYVVSIDAKKNTIVIGGREDLKSKGLVASNLNLLTDSWPKTSIVKIRYGSSGVLASLEVQKDELKVLFDETQDAVTPGQSVVVNDGDVVIGGGVIQQSIKTS